MESCRHKKSNDALKLFTWLQEAPSSSPPALIYYCMYNTSTMKHHFAVSRQNSHSLKWNFEISLLLFFIWRYLQKLQLNIEISFFSRAGFSFFPTMCLKSPNEIFYCRTIQKERSFEVYLSRSTISLHKITIVHILCIIYSYT